MVRKDAALHLKNQLLGCTSALEACIEVLEAEADDRQLSAYKRLTAHVMGSIFTELLVPLYKDFPDLEPEELKEARLRPREKKKLSRSLKQDLRKRLLGVEEKLALLATDHVDNEDSLSKETSFSFDEPLAKLRHLQTFLKRIDS